MSRVKILCTLGPATDGKIPQLIKAGMDGVRLNMSHGTEAENARRIREVRSHSKDVFIVVDTLGPKIRLGDFKELKVMKDDIVILTTSPVKQRVSGDIPVQYRNLHKCLNEGNKILIEDGLVGLRVYTIEGRRIICRVLYGSVLKSRKGVNIPNVSIPFPYTTQQDEKNIAFAVKYKVDFIADSFVRDAANVRALRRQIKDTDIRVIAKIENFEGVSNIDEIISEADGVMVARGDLGVEMPTEKVPALQKEIIHKCNKAGKPVVTATQMLDSMIRNNRPTRAEASDVFNAVVDGSDCVMLSGETSIGQNPIDSVSTMRRIVNEADPYVKSFDFECCGEAVDILTRSVAEAAKNPQISAVIIPTLSGLTAEMIARFKISKPVFVTTPHEMTRRQLSILWGVHAFSAPMNKPEKILSSSIELLRKKRLLKKGDMVIITAGVGSQFSGHTNMMQIVKV